jgi:glycosyltransferase involved in cell wall biosynthesis
MTRMPLVSIVIPAYNHARYLELAIASVLGQSYPAVETIVLDDGSTDDTRAVLANFGGKFYWESHPNIGQAATLNKGWTMCKGEILGYLSADDILLPDAVREAVEVLSTNPEVSATYCDFNLIDPESRVVRRVTTPEYSYKDMLVSVRCPPGPGAFFRRSAYAAAGPWDTSLRQMPDYDFWLRLGLHGRLMRIPKVLAEFRVHESSQTFARTDPVRSMEPVVIVSRLFDNAHLPAELKNLKGDALSNAHMVVAQLHIRAGRLRMGLASARVAASLRMAGIVSPRWVGLLLNALLNRSLHKLMWIMRRFRSGVN